MWSKFGQVTNVLPLYSPINQMLESDKDYRYLGFVMEYSAVGDLSQHIHQETIQKLTKSQKLRFLLGVAGAIQAGESYGVTHGDIKPKNILLFIERKTIVPKVMDFGMSASSSGDTHVHGGTPEYMAPECFASVSSDRSHITPASDIYSLGVLFHEFIRGESYIPRANSPSAFAERWERCRERHMFAHPDLEACEKFAEGMGILISGMLRRIEEGPRPPIKDVVDTLDAILEQIERATILNPEAGVSIKRGLYRWNPKFHEALGSSLYYFMIKGRWSKADIPWLETKFDEIQIRCYSLYRVLGAYDFILRAWLRSSHYSKLKETLDHFAEVHQGHVDVFSVDRMWPCYCKLLPSISNIEASFTEKMLDEIIKVESSPIEVQASRFAELNLATTLAVDEKARRRFFLIFPVGRPGSHVQTPVVEYYAEQIRQTLNQTAHAKHISVYAGGGAFSVMAKVRCAGIDEFRDIHSYLVDHCLKFRISDYPISIQTYVELYDPVRESDDGTILGEVARRKFSR
jgi:serine/threonine protein kinase